MANRKRFNGERLQRLRKSAGITQEQLVEMLHSECGIQVTRETISKIERNVVGTIDQINEALIQGWWLICMDKIDKQEQRSFISYLLHRYLK